jgi:hypothetical protein
MGSTCLYKESREILGYSISKEQNMLIIAQRFISKLVKAYGPNPVSTDGKRIWYLPQTCRFLKLQHHIIPLLRKASLLKELCNT